MLDIRHIVGLDLGQVFDYSALVSLRREQELPDPPQAEVVTALASLATGSNGTATKEGVRVVKTGPSRYYCNIAERFERGISYTVLADNIARLFQDPKFAGQTLVVDGTGVGRPVVDLIRKARPNCRLIPVTITGGGAMTALGAVNVDPWGYWHVPKKELVGSVQALLGTSRLEVAPALTHAAVLTQELKSFSWKISAASAHVTLEAWRDRDHDDLVLALALAAWAGERGQQLWVR